MQKRGLGRGLEELLGGREEGVSSDQLPVAGGRDTGGGEEIVMVEVGRLRGNPFQPRREMDEEGISELAESIRAYGVLQPIIARRMGDGYEVAAGERRWRAAKEAGLERVPVIVRAAGDKDMLQLALVENLQREDLKVMEEAEAYYALMQEYGMTQEELAQAVGKERATVANTMRLLTLPGEIQEALREEEISRGQGLALAGLVGRPQLRLVWRKVKEGGLSVRATEELVRSVMQPRGRRRTRDLGRDAEIEEIEERMREALGTMVTIKHDALSGSGKVEIKYSSKGELQNLWSRITGGEVRWTWGEKPEET